MKKIIFTGLLCIIGILSAEAQLRFKENRKGNTSSNKEFNKRFSKDPHWRFSDYQPQTSKKEQRRIKKREKELQARSYSLEKSPYFNKKEMRKARAIKKRQERVKTGNTSQTGKKVKLVRRDSQRKYDKKQRIRARKIRENKNNYGTKESRKSFQNKGDVFLPKPKLYN